MNRDTLFFYFASLRDIAKDMQDDTLPKFAIKIYNLAFAIEIGLKTIYCYSHDYALLKEHCHKLTALFDKQTAEIKDFFIRKLNCSMPELSNHLIVVGNNFQEWRYYFESEDLNGNDKIYKTNILFLNDMLDAISCWFEEFTC